MSYVLGLHQFLQDIKAMAPAGPPRLAKLMGVPRQTVHAWKNKVTSERSAKRILLDVEDVIRDKAPDMHAAVARALMRPAAPQGEIHG